jgi:hypothetical protein
LPEEFADGRLHVFVGERVEDEGVGELADGVDEVVFLREVEDVAGGERGEEEGEGFPGAGEGGGSAKVVELGEDAAGVVGVECVRAGVGGAGGEVVGFVDDEEGLGGGEAGLVVEERAVGGGEDVVVIADPDVLDREGGAGDFVGADLRGGAGGAEGGEVAGFVFEEIETGEAVAGPTLGDGLGVVEFAALAVADGVEAVLVFGADVPGRDGGRGLGRGGRGEGRRGGRFLPKRRFGRFVTY